MRSKYFARLHTTTTTPMACLAAADFRCSSVILLDDAPSPLDSGIRGGRGIATKFRLTSGRESVKIVALRASWEIRVPWTTRKRLRKFRDLWIRGRNSRNLGFPGSSRMPWQDPSRRTMPMRPM